MSPPSSEPVNEHRSLKDIARRELVRFAVLFVYLWAMFLLFELHQYVILASYKIPYESWGLGFVNALVLAKVMVVADEFHLNQSLRSKPLILPIALRSLCFAILFIAVDVAEKLLVGAFHGKSVVSSIPQYGGGGLLARVVVAIIIAVSLMPLFAFEEVDRVLGRGRLGEMLFWRRTSVQDLGDVQPS